SHDADSPPAPAWRRVNDEIGWLAPRSTCRNLVAPPEHHLSLLPPLTLPLTALAGPSLALHEESAVAGLLSARLVTPPGAPYTSNSSMRAAWSVPLVGVVMLSRTYRAVTALIGWYVRLDRLPDTVTRVVQVALSVLVWTLNAPVFQSVGSAPSPACLMTKALTVWFDPRSTVSVLVPLASEHHLESRPTAESKAIAGPSVAAHDAEPVAGLPAARFGPSSGAAGGGVKPSWKEGGTFDGLVPQEDAALPIVYCRVAPPAMVL